MTPLNPPVNGGRPDIRGATLPGQKKTDGLLDKVERDASRIYGARRGELLKLIEKAGGERELDELLREPPLEWLSRLGQNLSEHGIEAAQWGHWEVARRREKVTPLNPPASGGRSESATSHPLLTSPTEWRKNKIRAAMVEVVDAEGLDSLEWDFLNLRSFSIAQVDNARILQELKDELGKILQGGGTYGDFRAKADELLGESLSDAHGMTVYVTNLQTAYNSAKYYEGMSAADVLPYWQYVTAGDDRVRISHRLLEGQVWRKEDPIWDTIYPPNGFNCRCSVVEHDDLSLQQEGLKLSRGMPAGAGPDDGFAGNAASDQRMLEALIEKYAVVAQTAAELKLRDLAAQKAAAERAAAAELRDVYGAARTLPPEILQTSSGAWAAETLASPQEIWGWPNRHLYYLSAFETEQGPRTVVVEVWGDVKAVHIVSASEAEEYRSGMLLYRR